VGGGKPAIRGFASAKAAGTLYISGLTFSDMEKGRKKRLFRSAHATFRALKVAKNALRQRFSSFFRRAERSKRPFSIPGEEARFGSSLFLTFRAALNGVFLPLYNNK
jgi:hypothetical protein